MTSSTPSIEFFVGVSEELSNVSLRRHKNTGVRSVLMTFENLKALARFQSFTKRSYGNLRLIDSEGEISVEPSSLKFIFGGDEGDDLKRVECGFEIELEDHWERFMRFMHRYAEANGMAFSNKNKDQD
ncbi:MAG: photosystem II reaction center protein Psb28 [Xenococcaceae cyanobacterium]